MGLSRRDALGLAAAWVAASGRALAATPLPLDALKDAGGLTVLVPANSDYTHYQRYGAANLRVAKRPAARVLIRSAAGAQAAVNWARDHAVPFAIRGGGHCYEDFSQSDAVVFDLRPLSDVALDASGGASAGGGALLGQIYSALGEKGHVIPAGSCPQVGVAGHTQGGGFGLLGRRFGMACDSLVSAEVVDAKGRLLTASADNEPDLFWALRGGGGGSFGLVTRFNFRTHDLPMAARFFISWGASGALNPSDAAAILLAWQEWAPNAPEELTTILKVSGAAGRPALHGAGLSSEPDAAKVAAMLAPLAKRTGGRVTAIIPAKFTDQAIAFSGGPRLTGTLDDATFFQPRYYKGKSDVIAAPLTGAGARALVGAVVANPSAVAICDSHGGEVRKLADDATAYAHRQKTLFTIQYYSEWFQTRESGRELSALARVYSAMRPHVSGGAYVNYCDADLKDYEAAYWGGNVAKLKAVKKATDPDNLFRHAQSVRA